jgi:hypothetical protein
MDGRKKKFWVADNGAYVFKRISSDGRSGEMVFDGLIECNDNDYYIEMGQVILCAIVEFCCALSCSNVSHDEIVKPPEALSRARSAKGLSKLFSYHVLTIGGQSSGSSEQAINSTHASPRVHLRRGHIRRLPDKRVWVNACVVGDKSIGMVVKDYALQ